MLEHHIMGESLVLASATEGAWWVIVAGGRPMLGRLCSGAGSWRRPGARLSTRAERSVCRLCRSWSRRSCRVPGDPERASVDALSASQAIRSPSAAITWEEAQNISTSTDLQRAQSYTQAPTYEKINVFMPVRSVRLAYIKIKIL